MCDISLNNIKNKNLLNHISTNNDPQQPPPKHSSKIATHAIVDTGATAHYINAQAPCTNKRTLQNPTIVGLPNGNHLLGTEEADLKLNLPEQARKATIFQKMTKMSLLSVGALCDANMTAIFNKNTVKIHDSNNKCILTRRRDSTNGLWTLPLETNNPQANNVTRIEWMEH